MNQQTPRNPQAEQEPVGDSRAAPKDRVDREERKEAREESAGSRRPAPEGKGRSGPRGPASKAGGRDDGGNEPA